MAAPNQRDPCGRQPQRPCDRRYINRNNEYLEMARRTRPPPRSITPSQADPCGRRFQMADVNPCAGANVDPCGRPFQLDDFNPPNRDFTAERACPSSNLSFQRTAPHVELVNNGRDCTPARAIPPSNLVTSNVECIRTVTPGTSSRMRNPFVTTTYERKPNPVEKIIETHPMPMTVTELCIETEEQEEELEPEPEEEMEMEIEPECPQAQACPQSPCCQTPYACRGGEQNVTSESVREILRRNRINPQPIPFPSFRMPEECNNSTMPNTTAGSWNNTTHSMGSSRDASNMNNFNPQQCSNNNSKPVNSESVMEILRRNRISPKPIPFPSFRMPEECNNSTMPNTTTGSRNNTTYSMGSSRNDSNMGNFNSQQCSNNNSQPWGNNTREWSNRNESPRQMSATPHSPRYGGEPNAHNISGCRQNTRPVSRAPTQLDLYESEEEEQPFSLANLQAHRRQRMQQNASAGSRAPSPGRNPYMASEGEFSCNSQGQSMNFSNNRRQMMQQFGIGGGGGGGGGGVNHPSTMQSPHSFGGDGRRFNPRDMMAPQQPMAYHQTEEEYSDSEAFQEDDYDCEGESAFQPRGAYSGADPNSTRVQPLNYSQFRPAFNATEKQPAAGGDQSCSQFPDTTQQKIRELRSHVIRVAKMQHANLVLDNDAPGAIQETIDGSENFNVLAFDLIFGNMSNAPHQRPPGEPISLLEAFRNRILTDRKEMKNKGKDFDDFGEFGQGLDTSDIDQFYSQRYKTDLNRALASLFKAERFYDYYGPGNIEKQSTLQVDLSRTQTMLPGNLPIKFLVYAGSTKPNQPEVQFNPVHSNQSEVHFTEHRTQHVVRRQHVRPDNRRPHYEDSAMSNAYRD